MEYLFKSGEQTVVLVNPNITREFKTNVCGVDYVFEPMRKKLTPASLATQLIERANETRANCQMQSDAERKEYLRLVEHKDASLKAVAKKFVEVDENGNFVDTITKPWPKVPLIRLDDDTGKKLYAEAVLEARQHGMEIEEEDDMDPSRKSVMELVQPKKEWESKLLVDWINEQGGTASYHENMDSLVKKANKLYEHKKALFQKLGLKVYDPTETKMEAAG